MKLMNQIKLPSDAYEMAMFDHYKNGQKCDTLLRITCKILALSSIFSILLKQLFAYKNSQAIIFGDLGDNGTVLSRLTWRVRLYQARTRKFYYVSTKKVKRLI